MINHYPNIVYWEEMEGGGQRGGKGQKWGGSVEELKGGGSER